MEDSKRARSWKRRIRPRINLKNDEPVLPLPDRLLLRTVFGAGSEKLSNGKRRSKGNASKIGAIASMIP